MKNVWNRGEIYTKILVCKPEGKRPLGRRRHKWEDIKIYLEIVGCELDPSGPEQEPMAGLLTL
jgi:hypothetical protein